MIGSIEKMVALPTVRDDKIPQYENPAIVAFGKLIEGMARDFGLKYRNIDNRVYEISLGEGKEVIGIHAHADVVPVTPANWKLADGTKLDPFKPEPPRYATLRRAPLQVLHHAHGFADTEFLVLDDDAAIPHHTIVVTPIPMDIAVPAGREVRFVSELETLAKFP